MNHARGISALIACALLALAVVHAQDDWGDEPPEPPPEVKKSTLLPRSPDDPQTIAWVGKTVVTRPRVLNTEPGAILRHVMSPDGERIYYFRALPTDAPKDATPQGPTPDRFALYTVGPGKGESKVADTGADCTPPIFLSDGRILFSVRRSDTNEDQSIDELDDATLMISNRDGGNQRRVATLPTGETPVAVWREDREVLICVAGEDDVNGPIVSLNLVRGDRQHITHGINVELVLPDGRLLIERQQPAVPERSRDHGWNRRGEPEPEPEPVETPKPTLVDHSEHVLFEPKDNTETLLYRPNRRSRIVVHADNAFFGNQEPDPADNTDNWSPWGMETSLSRYSEILIVDDAQHFDVRSPSARFNYLTIGWIQERGLLVIEQGNLGSRLLLLDRALNSHRLADFELDARGFVASADGLTIAWLQVDDTDKNGHLEPWKDHSRIQFIRIE